MPGPAAMIGKKLSLIPQERLTRSERMRRLPPLRVMAAIACALCGIGLAFSFLVFYRSARPDAEVSVHTPERLFLPAEALRIAAADGEELAGWFIPAEGGGVGRAVLILPGAGTRKEGLLPVAAAFHPHFAVLLLDLRAHGESGGMWSTFGLREGDDAVRAVEYLAGRGARSIGVFGITLGANAAIAAGAASSEVDAVAAYMPFADIGTLVRERAPGFGPVRWFAERSFFFWSRLLFGADPRALSPLDDARRLSQPVLHMHPRHNPPVSFDHARRFLTSFSSNDRVELFFPDADGRSEEYARQALDFFERRLSD